MKDELDNGRMNVGCAAPPEPKVLDLTRVGFFVAIGPLKVKLTWLNVDIDCHPSLLQVRLAWAGCVCGL